MIFFTKLGIKYRDTFYNLCSTSPDIKKLYIMNKDLFGSINFQLKMINPKQIIIREEDKENLIDKKIDKIGYVSVAFPPPVGLDIKFRDSFICEIALINENGDIIENEYDNGYRMPKINKIPCDFNYLKNELINIATCEPDDDSILEITNIGSLSPKKTTMTDKIQLTSLSTCITCGIAFVAIIFYYIRK